MSQTPDIEFIRLARSNARQLSGLKVRDSEEHLIASNAQWIAMAAFIDEATTYGMFRAGAPCGLISLIDPRLVQDEEGLENTQDGCLYVWRLMVDQHHRGHDVGTAAIRFAERQATALGFRGVSLTTMDHAELNALPFYTMLGFAPTGRRLGGEIELIKTFDPA